MSALSQGAAQLALNWLLNVGTPTRPTGLYLALFTSTEDNVNSGTEVTGNGYTRQAVTFGSATTAGVSSNTNAPTFTAAGGDFGTITYGAIFDAATAGNEVWYGPMQTQRLVKNGDTISFPVGQIQLSLS